MIYTVTFNPALDYVVHMDADPVMGETNRSTGEELYYGGKGINVSLVLGRLGMESIALGFVAGFTGEALEKGVKEMGIRSDFIRLSSGNTRINLKLRAGSESEINCRGPEIPRKDAEALFGKIGQLRAGDWLLLAGSIPGSMPADSYEEILQRLRGKGAEAIVDASGELLRRTLPYHPFLIKPNRRELEDLFGVRDAEEADLLRMAGALQREGARNVLISLGGEGALLLTEQGEVMRSGGISGTVLGTVGSGDSMVAGFLTGYIRTGDFRRALLLGNAAGAASAFSEGLAEGEDILRIYREIGGEELL